MKEMLSDVIVPSAFDSNPYSGEQWHSLHNYPLVSFDKEQEKLKICILTIKVMYPLWEI